MRTLFKVWLGIWTLVFMGITFIIEDSGEKHNKKYRANLFADNFKGKVCKLYHKYMWYTCKSVSDFIFYKIVSRCSDKLNQMN